MSHRHPTLHPLCPLSPWAGYWHHQPMASRLPMVPRKASVVGFGSAMAGSPVMGAKWRHIKKIERLRCIGLRWPTLWRKTQQSNRSLRLQWEGCWRGGAASVEHVGGRYRFDMGSNLKDKKPKILYTVALDGRWSINLHTTTNQKQVPIMEESRERRQDYRGA